MNFPLRKAIDFSDGRVSFLEWKSHEGAPTIVFAHANGFNANTYRSILSPLAERFRILALDLRGHGMTQLPTHPSMVAGWTVYRDDLLRFLHGVGGDRVLLAGHSLGATSMLMTAAARPRSVRAIVLAEPVIPTNALVMRAVIARFLSREDSMLPLVAPAKRRRASFATQEDALSAFRGRGGFKTWPRDDLIVDYIQGGTVSKGGGILLACAPSWEAANFTVYPFGLAKLGRHVDVPLTVLHADRESSVPTKMLDQLARAHGNAHVVRVEGTTHFLPMEKPDVVRAEIIATAERAGLL